MRPPRLLILLLVRQPRPHMITAKINIPVVNETLDGLW